MPASDSFAASPSSDASSPRDRRGHNQGNQERKYTPEQEAAVLRILRCQPTAFYEILELPKTCSDAAVKKAYRKLSLLTHPDKNGHEKADEAFKMVARAFSVLGDKQKRETYDQFGTDPDSRFASARQHAAHAQNPFAGAGGFAGRRGGMGGWDGEEISPEEMFARFFSGGAFGGGFGGPFGGFDGGPQFVFNFGGPGVRVHRFGGARPRGRPRNPGQEEPTSMWSTIIGLLPVLLLVFWPLLSSIFSAIIPSGPSTPSMAFEFPNPPTYTEGRTTPNGVRYYVNPADIQSYSPSKLHTLDKNAEVLFIRGLRLKCEEEQSHRQQLRNEAQGWFFPDPAKMELANNYDMPACRRLKSFGY
ncbi:hypothetical protein VTK26DRAFT_4666 [Humicola hyalothermophila]